MDSEFRPGRLRPEAQLILACCAEIGQDESARFAGSLVETNFDWEWLERCAQSNGVMPLVARRLPSFEIPNAHASSAADHLRRFKIALQANALRNEHLTNELVRILARFYRADIDALSFKGPVLAATAYGDLALRSFADLDILVHRRDMEHAVRLLAQDGYGLSSGRAVDPAIFTAFEGGFEAQRGDDHVDLHYRIRRRRFHFFPDDDGIWDRSIWVDLNGYRVRTFAPGDLALYLCAHASKHGWMSLQMVCDLAAVLRFPALDTDAALEQAAKLGCRRMMLMGLYLANLLLGTKLSESTRRTLHDDPAIPALAGPIADRMFSGVKHESAAENPAGTTMDLMDRRRDRLRYWFFRAVTPTMGDWEFVPLPRALYPAYFLIRPFRLVFAFLRKTSGISQ